MSTKENKELIRRVYELINQGDMDAYSRYCTPDFVEHFTDRDLSSEQTKQFDAMFGAALEFLSVTITSMVAEGDKVAVLVTWKMKHTGEFMAIPPTGKKVEMTNANVFRIAEGRIVEAWNVMDMLFLQRLGMIPKR
jgi:predicted ester cyclase